MNRPVFLDRDSVQVRASARNGKPYAPRSVSEFEILPDARPATRALKAAGFRLEVAINQPDVGLSSVSRAAVEEMHRQLLRELPLDTSAVGCPRPDEGGGGRTPRPGMPPEAIRKLKLDVAESFMVGDRWSDDVVGRRVG